jgi:hypothetical protein
MGKVIASAATSLDGFVADPDDAVGPLFDWYNNGDVAITGADPDRSSTSPRRPRATCAPHGPTSARR